MSEQGPDWFLVATEACGGVTPDLGFFLGVSVFIGTFGVSFTSGGSPSRPRDRGGAPCYLLSTSLDFLEEERRMQQSSISISLSF